MLASLAGLGLLLLSRGLFLRLDGAYWLTLLLLAAAFGLAWLKGFDIVTAVTVLMVLLALLPCRHAFYRKASLLDQPFSVGWMTTIGVIVAGSIWLGFFSYRHVDYADQLWWQFTFSDGAPRFLRASLLVVVASVIFALMKLLRPARRAPQTPSPEALAQAIEVVESHGGSESNLVRLGDKRLLFSENGKAFIMFGTAGHSWIALGEPVVRRKNRLNWSGPFANWRTVRARARPSIRSRKVSYRSFWTKA